MFKIRSRAVRQPSNPLPPGEGKAICRLPAASRPLPVGGPHFNNIKTAEQWYRSCIMQGGQQAELPVLSRSAVEENVNKLSSRQE